MKKESYQKQKPVQKGHILSQNCPFWYLDKVANFHYHDADHEKESTAYEKGLSIRPFLLFPQRYDLSITIIPDDAMPE
jgi:hypothetical protein